MQQDVIAGFDFGYMRELDRTFAEWFLLATCDNPSERPMLICVDGKPRRLDPGKSSLRVEDCAGVILPDGSAYKIHGRSGIRTRETKEFVKKHWPECAKEVEVWKREGHWDLKS